MNKDKWDRVIFWCSVVLWIVLVWSASQGVGYE